MIQIYNFWIYSQRTHSLQQKYVFICVLAWFTSLIAENGNSTDVHQMMKVELKYVTSKQWIFIQL